MKMPELCIDDLLGVRFRNHGRSISEGFDCYGLAIEVSKRLGHTLIDLWYERSCEDTFAAEADGMYTKMSEMVEDTREQELGNLILFADEAGRMIHIGVILEKGMFIHAVPCGGVKVTRIEDYHRKNWKVYKWRQ